jgi:HD-like signal output (HDOD) protein
MARTTEPTNPIVEAAVGGMSHVATLPEITLRIIDLVEDPTSTAQDLREVIASDPALCSRIIKVVNSAFYGLPRQIGSIDRAVVLLGLNAVKNIAIAASLSKLFRGGDLGPSFSARDLWTHSVATAGAAKQLADELGLSSTDETFLAGLMHDLGVIVEIQVLRSKLIPMFDELRLGADGYPTADMREVERRHLGADHTQFGAGLCESWKFPPALTATTRFHHEPWEAPAEHRRLVSIVHVADRVAASHGIGFRLDIPDPTLDPALLEELGLDGATIARVGLGIQNTAAEIECLFG